MKKYTLTQVYRTDKDKDGKPLVSKTGKAYAKCNIKVEEHGDKWLSGFGNAGNQAWVAGDQVQLMVSEKEFNGSVYLQYEVPKAEDLLAARVSALELDMLNVKKSLAGTPAAPSKETKIEEIPDIDF